MPKVLVIEDDSCLRSEICETLELADKFQIFEAENGYLGLQLAKREIPDLVISDINMPNMNGMEMLGHLRADPLTSHIPFVFLTGNTDTSTYLRALELGANAYLIKPMGVAELLQQVDKLLQSQAQPTLSSKFMVVSLP